MAPTQRRKPLRNQSSNGKGSGLGTRDTAIKDIGRNSQCPAARRPLRSRGIILILMERKGNINIRPMHLGPTRLEDREEGRLLARRRVEKPRNHPLLPLQARTIRPQGSNLPK